MNHTLKISKHAQRQLESLYIYGFEKWGEKQADLYYDLILRHFDMLCDNPLLYTTVDDIKVGYRRSVCGKHAIYYRVNGKVVEIMAILKKQNYKNHLY